MGIECVCVHSFRGAPDFFWGLQAVVNLDQNANAVRLANQRGYVPEVGLRKIVIAVLACMLVTGCSSKYRVDALNPPAARLAVGASFYVSLPKDGAYGNELYPGSGQMTANASVAALARHVSKIEQARTVEETNLALESARQRGYSHVFEPQILHWEDRATEWSGKPDRITLKFTVYDVQTSQPVASTVSSASSKWGTLGGDHPQDLLPVPTQRFVDSLF